MKRKGVMEKTVLVFTDYEPDDYLALLIIARLFKNVTLVVTENNAEVRQKKCEDIKFFFPEFPVFRGTGSTKPYDFVKDAAAPENTFAEYDFKQMDAPDIVFGIAPPRDMIAVTKVDPNYFKQSRVYFYGGFNFACVMDYDVDLTTWFTDSFKSVVVFETRPSFGDRLNFNPTSGPLIAFLESKSDDPKFKRFLELNEAWDAHILAKMIAKISAFQEERKDELPECMLPIGAAMLRDHLKSQIDKCENDAKWFFMIRSLDVVIAVSSGGHESVAADPVVVIMHDEPLDSPRLKPVVFTLPTPEKFVYESVEKSNLYLFDPDGIEAKHAAHDEVEQKIINALK